MRVQSPGTSANFSVSADAVTTCRTSPRSTRSARSRGPSSVVAGMTTAPSLMQASITSHSGATLPSTSSSRSPRSTPSARSQDASCAERVGQLGVGQLVLGAVVVHDPQRRDVGLLGGQHVEPVEAEVEVRQLRPRGTRRPPARSRRGASAGGHARPGTSRWRCWLPGWLPCSRPSHRPRGGQRAPRVLRVDGGSGADGYREAGEAALAWSLGQVRGDAGPWIPVTVPADGSPALPPVAEERDCLYQGTGGIALALAEVRLARDLTEEERAIAEAVRGRLVACAPDQVDPTLYFGLAGDATALRLLGGPDDVAGPMALLAGRATPQGWPAPLEPGGEPVLLTDVVLGSAGITMAAAWAGGTDSSASGHGRWPGDGRHRRRATDRSRLADAGGCAEVRARPDAQLLARHGGCRRCAGDRRASTSGVPTSSTPPSAAQSTSLAIAAPRRRRLPAADDGPAQQPGRRAGHASPGATGRPGPRTSSRRSGTPASTTVRDVDGRGVAAALPALGDDVGHPGAAAPRLLGQRRAVLRHGGGR